MGGILPLEPARHLKPDHTLHVTVGPEPDDPRQLVGNVCVSSSHYYLWRTEGEADQPVGPI